MISRILNSLSARLLGIFLVAALLYAVAAYFAVNFVLNRDEVRELIGPHVALYMDYILEEIGEPPSIENATRITQRIPVDLRIVGDELDWSSDPNFPSLEALDFGAISQEYQDDHKVWGEALTTAGYYREGRHRFVRFQRDDYIVVFASPKIATEVSRIDTRPILVAIALVLLAACYFAVQWQVRPIQWIREGAARIGAGELDYRIKTHRRDDLGSLSRDINKMADDVLQMLDAKRQMLLAISHELRSPVTRAKVALEFVEDPSLRDPIAADLGEMEQLISDLLETERLNTKHRVLNLDDADANQLVQATLDEYLAQEHDRVELGLTGEAVPVHWDGPRFKLALKNLIDNGLRHSPPGQSVQVLVRRPDASSVRVTITDHGEGIPAADLANVMEPFYRADPSRQRNTGGFGLGLYLARLVAEAHGGTLEIDSTEGEGTQAHLTLPAQVQAAARKNPN